MVGESQGANHDSNRLSRPGFFLRGAVFQRTGLLRFSTCTQGNRPHTWTHSWLFPAEAPVEPADGAYRVRLSGGLDLRFAVASTTPLDVRDDRRSWCPVYAEKACARWVRFSSSCTTARRAFVFAPDPADAPVPAIELDDTGVCLTIGPVRTRIAIDA